MLNNYEFQRYITTIAHNNGLRVVWTEETEPRADATSIYIPRGSIEDTELDWKRRLFFAVHEAGGHQRYTDFNFMAGKGVNAKNSLLGLIHNACEDVRVDFLNAAEFDGDRQLCDEVMGEHFDSTCVALSKKMKSVDEKAKAYIENVSPIMEFMVHSNADMFRTYDASRGKFAAFLRTEEAKQRYDKLCHTNSYLDEMRRIREIVNPVRGTKATWDLAVRIFEELFDGDAEKEQERCKQEAKDGKDKGDNKGGDGTSGKDKSKESKEGKPKDGEGNGQSKGKGKAEDGSESAAQGDGDDQGETDNEYKHVEVDYSEAIQDNGGRVSKSRTDVTLNSDWESRYNKPYSPAAFNEHTVVDCLQSGYERKFPYSPGGDRYGAALDRINPAFANQVRQKLQVRDRSRWEYAKKRGTMHRPALHRVLIKDAPGYNERVFKNKIVSDTLNTAITILVDSSGSMSGRKYEHAAASAVLLNDSLGNTLHIPLEIVGFTEWGSSPVNIIHRTHDTKQLSKDKLTASLCVAGNNLANNPDGECVNWCYERLLKRKEKRKLMIVISDGHPADCMTRGDPAAYLKHVVSTIEREKRVEIYAVGVMTEAVKHFYKEYSIINSSEQLETTLLQLIDRKVV